MSDLGNVSLVLGMQVSRDRAKGSLTISQESYCLLYTSDAADE